MKFIFPFLLGVSYLSSSFASIRINEVADKGTNDVCNGEDWIELYLPSYDDTLNLTGYIIHDDNGPEDEDAFVFPPTVINSDEYILMCTKQDVAESPSFGIGADDTITLRSPNGTIISTTGQLSGLGSSTVTYAFNDDIGAYDYTSTPTPAAENIFTAILTTKEALAAQNALGTSFFNMDDKGYPVANGLDAILDFRMTMEEDELAYMWANQSYELYSTFSNVTLTSYENPSDILYAAKSPGRIRPRGQSTLYFSTCFNISAMPFTVDFTSSDSAQTFFGVEVLYLRSGFDDGSYLREWAIHRMLARFGLPHLRARVVRFFINDMYIGLYTMLEAVDQKYVFHRSFPDFDPDNYALFKVKTNSIGCGLYTEEELAYAYSRINETNTPPYSYDRGEHRQKVDVVGNPYEDPINGVSIGNTCVFGFFEMITANNDDTRLAYVRGGENCGKVLVDQGLVDRDLGEEKWNKIMSDFYNKHLGPNLCEPGCVGNDLASDVDTDDFLKNFAVYAVLNHMDSPMGNGNNYYLANTGDGKGWKIVQWDHNSAMSAAGADICNPKCASDLIEWSIVRPTCFAFEYTQLVGPLLSNPNFHEKYLGYVESFLNITLDPSFLDEVRNHAVALRKVVDDDPWSYLPYLRQMSLDPVYWNATLLGEKIDPFLPILIARSEEVEKQLQALKDGTFPRSADEVKPDEICPNWKATEPDYPCPMNCMYEGCHIPEWSIPSGCDAAQKICYHGNVDEKCEDVAFMESYEGMAEGFFCIYVDDTPTAFEYCSPPSNGIDVEIESGGAMSKLYVAGFAAMISFLVAW